MKTALITGITGQDGSYLAQLLLQKDYKVIGLTRSYNNVNTANFKYLNIDGKVGIEECDLLDFSSIIKNLIKYKPLLYWNSQETRYY